MRQLREVCRKHGVARIVVGLPLHITGETGEMGQEASAFAARVRRDLKIEVELLDERLTSWEARETLAETNSTSSRSASRSPVGSSSRRKSVPIDDIAAAILLRDYLESKRRSSESAGKDNDASASLIKSPEKD